MSYPVYINCFNRLSCTKQLAEQCSKLEQVKEVVLIDNASTYPPLLDWYRTGCPYRVIRLEENLGIMAPWECRTVFETKGKYVVTDCDLDIGTVPKHVLGLLNYALDKYEDRAKVGLSLEIDDLPDEYLFKQRVLEIENKYWQNKIDKFWDAPIDTTFALYSPDRPIGGPSLRTSRPYTAKHLPWYITEPNEEDIYYLDHLSSNHKPGCYWSTLASYERLKIETIDKRFDRLREEETDIKDQFMVLHELANKSNRIVEMGFRHGVSATALYRGLITPLVDCSSRKLTCYDLQEREEHKKFLAFSRIVGMPKFEFIQGDSRQVEIEACDLLLLDTDHRYELLKQELERHSPHVSSWIAIHDTTRFGEQGDDGKEGLWQAIEEFLAQGTFTLRTRHMEQNGMTILQRRV